jgi:hypothetical protein
VYAAPELADILMWTLIEVKTPADELPHIDEPLQLSANKKPARRWWQTTGLMFLLLLLIASLVGQLAYFYRQQPVAQSASRAVMSQICEFTGCTLPLLSDPSQIQVSELSLNDHPEYRNITVLTANLQNRADFAQIMPDLVLQFSNPQGEPVAGRKFSAQDYATERSANNPGLGAGEMISAQLAFASPGDNAVNYRLTLVQPAGSP